MAHRSLKKRTSSVLKLSKPSFKKIETTVPFKGLVIAGFCMSIVTSVVLLVVQNELPPQVPLFYGLPKSEDQLTTSLGLLVPNLISIAFQIFNILLSLFMKDDFLKKTLIVASFATAIFASITTLRVMLLVTSFL